MCKSSLGLAWNKVLGTEPQNKQTNETKPSTLALIMYNEIDNLDIQIIKNQSKNFKPYTVNNYMQVTGMTTGENFAFFIYKHFVEIL